MHTLLNYSKTVFNCQTLHFMFFILKFVLYQKAFGEVLDYWCNTVETALLFYCTYNDQCCTLLYTLYLVNFSKKKSLTSVLRWDLLKVVREMFLLKLRFCLLWDGADSSKKCQKLSRAGKVAHIVCIVRSWTFRSWCSYVNLAGEFF